MQEKTAVVQTRTKISPQGNKGHERLPHACKSQALHSMQEHGDMQIPKNVGIAIPMKCARSMGAVINAMKATLKHFCSIHEESG